jgi:hypothetical protein
VRVAVVGATGQVDGLARSTSHDDICERTARNAVQLAQTLLTLSA